MKKFLVVMALVVSVSAVAQAAPTDYYNAVMALDPTAYFRMNTPGGYQAPLIDDDFTPPMTPISFWGVSTLAGSDPDSLVAGQPYSGLEATNTCALFRATSADPDQQDLGNPGIDPGGPGTQVYNQEEMTYSFIYKSLDDYGNDERMVVNVPGEDNDFKVILAGDNMVLTTSTNGWNTQYEGATTGLDMTDQQWHHIVAVRNGDDCSMANLYVDGVDVWGSSVSSGDSHGTSGGSTARIGARHSAYFAGWGNFDGWMDEVVIYSKALTAVEAQGLYAALPEPATLSLLAMGGIGVLLRKKR